MRRFLLLLFPILCISVAASAQCVPGTITSTAKWYLIPDSATGLKHACPGNMYEETIYIKALKDTALSAILSATIDSFVIDMSPASTGLPSYITATSVPALVNNKLRIKGDSLACIKLSGAVPGATIPSKTPLNFSIKVYAKLFGVIDTNITVPYTSYSFVVDTLGTSNCWAASINHLQQQLPICKAVPNPASETVKFVLTTQEVDTYNFSLTNAVGQTIQSQPIKTQKGETTIHVDISSLQKGIYFYTLSKNTIFVTQRLVIH